MIIVCEPVCWGLEHVPTNAGLLEIIRIAFPHETILFYGEKSHSRYIREEMRSEVVQSIIWKTLNIPPRHERFLYRIPSDFRLMRILLNEVGRKLASHLLITYGNPSILWSLKILLKSIHRGKNVQVIFHGGLASIAGWRSRNPFTRIQDFRTVLGILGNSDIHYILLEQPIREALEKELPSLHSNVHVLDHPVPKNERAELMTTLNSPIRFGFLGLATKQKGFFKYLEVASEISTKFPGKAEFHIIGRIHSDYLHIDLPELSVLSTKPFIDRLPRNEYVSHLRKLHFVCLFFKGKYYNFSPSGVFLDCIALGKPIIASKLPIFEHVRDSFGDIGFLCENGEFCQTIETIITESNPDRYKSQVLNIREVKKSRTPQSLANKYREICQEF
jgi:hypothetical protein